MATGTKENENALAPTSEIVRVYNEVTSVDDTAMIRTRLARLSGFVVTGDEENVKAAKKTRAALNGLAKDASAARMRVQRAIKAHPIGAFAFEKTDLEREIEKESKRLGDDIAHAVNAPKVRLNEEVDTYVCFVRGTLAQINKLAVYANEELGLNFENRGPVAPEGAQTQPMM
jgi:uncharacterized membrane-anchored protein